MFSHLLYPNVEVEAYYQKGLLFTTTKFRESISIYSRGPVETGDQLAIEAQSGMNVIAGTGIEQSIQYLRHQTRETGRATYMKMNISDPRPGYLDNVTEPVITDTESETNITGSVKLYQSLPSRDQGLLPFFATRGALSRCQLSWRTFFTPPIFLC